MRRKSERTKEKDKPSPGKKSEKATRRSRRQARKKRRSVSSSPEKGGSGTEENETSLKSSQEDTEEEQVPGIDESSCQVGAIITADVASTSEVEEDSQSVSARCKRLKKLSECVSADAEKPTVTTKSESDNSEWKEDKTFWEENETKPESSEHKHKEKDGKSSVWKVKSADGGGGEIQKLKLCIVRPLESLEPSQRKKKRLRRSGSEQREKSDFDDTESGKGSQEDEGKLSADEKSYAQKPLSDLVESSEETHCADAAKSEAADDSQVGIEQTSQSSLKTKEKEGNESSEDVLVVSVANRRIVEGNHAESLGDSEKSFQHVNDREEETGIVERKDEELQEPSVRAVDKECSVVDSEQQRDCESIGNASLRSITPEGNIEVAEVAGSRDDDDSNIPVNKMHSSECSEKNDHKTPEKVTSKDTSVDGEKDAYENAADASKIVEKHGIDDAEKVAGGGVEGAGEEVEVEKEAEKDTSEDPNVLSLTTDEIVSDDLHPRVEALDITSDSVESKSRDDPFELKNVPSSPEDQRNSNNDGDVLKLQEGSSGDEKEVIKGLDIKENSPRFRERRRECRVSRERKTKIPEEKIDRDLEGSVKHRRRFERRSHSPRRREKISLRRSFSGRRKESDPKNDTEYPEAAGKINYRDNSNKENARKSRSDRDASIDITCTSVPRKRRWGQSNSSRPSKKPVLSISTDSLKTLIPGAKPVPIGEVQLIPEDEVKKGFDLWGSERVSDKEKSVSDVKEDVPEKNIPPILPDASRLNVAITDDQQSKIVTRKISIVLDDARNLQKSPSPPRHKVTNILFITNLVRPFTVNQLKELLARTGKIVEGGFWIDKIKSRCYVEYETESEAKETRHALHGVRWPVSNPKTLCVDFGKKEDMVQAQTVVESDLIPRKTEPLKVERTMDAWATDQTREKEREREIRERGREAERERERPRGKERIHSSPVEVEHNKKAVVREWDLGKIGQASSPEREPRYEEKREKERKLRKEKSHRSRSVSPREPPARKVKKKEEDAPAKLLDDLFRKTKTTPCIYWLPLTAEQIVVKEEMRRKHMAEHERRMAEMRKAERERERVRAQQRQQRRATERDKRRRRSGSGSPKK